MNWLAVIAALISGISDLIAYLNRRQIIQDAEAAAAAAHLKEALNVIKKANAARADVAAHPERVHDPKPDDRPWNPDDLG